MIAVKSITRPGIRVALYAAVAIVCAACSHAPPPPSAAQLAGLPWDSVVARAKGTSVTWAMWRGDPSINAYVDKWVAPRLLAQYGITINTVDSRGPALLNRLAVERQARSGPGTTDLLWINGETFWNLRKSKLLYGPWASRLPNARYVDSSSTIIMHDFEQNTAGYESPWGTVEFALIYDPLRTPNPPHTIADLAAWIRAHPGRFTYDQSFTGQTFLTTVMYALNGGVERFQGGFNEATYRDGSARLFDWLEELRPYLWRRGTTYPQDVAALHRLFANREVDFTMSNNQNEVVTKTAQGILPGNSRALLLRDGVISNAHYLGIASTAPNPAGAMVVANFLLSPAAQLEKQKPDVWADGTVLDPLRLPPEWAARFKAIESEIHGLSRDSLTKYARPEVAPQYREQLEQDWRTKIRDAPRP